MQTEPADATKTLAGTLEQYAAEHQTLVDRWPGDLERFRAAKLALIAVPGAVAEYGMGILTAAQTDADRAKAKVILTAAEKMASARPRQLEVAEPAPGEIQIAVALWKQRLAESLAAKTASREPIAGPVVAPQMALDAGGAAAPPVAQTGLKAVLSRLKG